MSTGRHLAAIICTHPPNTLTGDLARDLLAARSVAMILLRGWSPACIGLDDVQIELALDQTIAEIRARTAERDPLPAVPPPGGAN